MISGLSLLKACRSASCVLRRTSSRQRPEPCWPSGSTTKACIAGPGVTRHTARRLNHNRPVQFRRQAGGLHLLSERRLSAAGNEIGGLNRRFAIKSYHLRTTSLCFTFSKKTRRVYEQIAV